MTALEKIRRNIKGKLHWSSDQMTHYWSFSFSQKSVFMKLKINKNSLLVAKLFVV